MKRVRAPLSMKFSALVSLVVLAFGLTHLVVIRALVEPRLREVEDLRTRELTRSLAATLSEPLMVDDFLEVDRRMEVAMRETDIRYAFVVTKDGQVAARTFATLVPESLLRFGRGNSFTSRVVELSGSRVRDVAVPLENGHLGHLRIGLGEDYVARSMRSAGRVLGLMVLAFLVLGVAGAAWYASVLTRPLVAIIETVDRFRLDGRFVPEPIPREDEIGAVARAVNETLQRLEASHGELSRAQSQLQDAEKLASIGVLASGVAHDINNPLAGIRNCLVRIEAAPDRVDQTTAYAKLMLEATEHIEQVVRGLLDFVRKRPPRADLIAVDGVVGRALRLCSYRLRERAIETSVRFNGDVGPVRGDENKLVQAFVNVFLNAVDAMPTGGRIEVQGEARDGLVCVMVRDSGSGIPSELLDRVFEPFFSTKGATHGTGLGLPVTHMIVVEHGGRIGLQSDRTGTMVRIDLPMA
ncbi:MAG: HAMP domain-containing protein [Deltaproteobacteria bacterium]|nr:HAMP domain-containing protein [Deltaproteobacteria bacterium]